MSARPHAPRAYAGTRAGGDRGGAIVEYVAVFPIALVVILLCFEALMSGLMVERVENAARTGARTASRQQDAGACHAAAIDAMPGWINKKEADGGWRGDGLYCHVRAKIPVLWPGAPLDFTIDRTVHMPVG